MNDRTLHCAHVWIHPNDPLRRPYVPIIGPGRYQMKLGEVYRCRYCQVALPIGAAALTRLPIASELPEAPPEAP